MGSMWKITLAQRTLALRDLIQREHHALLPRLLHPARHQLRPLLHAFPPDIRDLLPGLFPFSTPVFPLSDPGPPTAHPLRPSAPLLPAHPVDHVPCLGKRQPLPDLAVVEEGGLEGFGEGEAEEAVVPAVGEDEGGPFLELGAAGGEVGLGGPEGGEGVGQGEGEGGGHGGRRGGRAGRVVGWWLGRLWMWWGGGGSGGRFGLEVDEGSEERGRGGKWRLGMGL